MCEKKPGQNRSVGPVYHTLPVLKSRKRPQPQNLCNLTGLWGWGALCFGQKSQALPGPAFRILLNRVMKTVTVVAAARISLTGSARNTANTLLSGMK